MKRSTGGSLYPPTALIDAVDVLRVPLEDRLVDVDDREVGVGEPLRRRGDGVALREADADDKVEALTRERRHVRHVVGRGLRLDDAARDPELALRPLETFVRKLVEAVVVELARVCDEADPERRRRRRPGGVAARLLVASAALSQHRDRRHCGSHGEQLPRISGHRHS
jgi:hypothetical protein